MSSKKPSGPDRQEGLFLGSPITEPDDATTEEICRPPKRGQEREGSITGSQILLFNKKDANDFVPARQLETKEKSPVEIFAEKLRRFSLDFDEFDDGSISLDVWCRRRPEPRELLQIATAQLGELNALVVKLKEAVDSFSPGDVRNVAQNILREMQTN